MAPVKCLGDSVSIGRITTRNRLCIPPMVLYGHAGADGLATEAHVRHYEALARGGAGLLIQEATCVTPGGRLSRDQLGIWSDSQLPGLRRITQAVHRAGCPVLIQLHHAGVVSIGPERLCPDRYRLLRKSGPVTGQKMTPADMEAVKAAFISAGHRAFLAGYDGVELHGCHSYLLSQFLNCRVNRREDCYGREPVRLLAEIMAGIRAAAGPEFVIGVRLGAFEPALADGIRHARQLEAAGAQFLDVSYGFSGEMDLDAPGDPRFPDTIRGADAIAQSVSIPVFGVGGICTPEDAAAVLEETALAMVDVGRSALVDPAWPQKALSGEQPGRCLHCKVCQWRIKPSRCPGRSR